MKFNNSTPSRLGGAKPGNRRLEVPQDAATGSASQAEPERVDDHEGADAAEGADAPEAAEALEALEVADATPWTQAEEVADEEDLAAAEEKHEEDEEEKEEEAEEEMTAEPASAAAPRAGKVGLRDLLSGEVLTREGVLANVPFLVFVATLFVAYVALGYQFERIEREKQRTLRRVRELNAEFKSLEAAFETQLQQSQVERNVAPLGLGQSLEPPYVIEVEPLESEAP